MTEGRRPVRRGALALAALVAALAVLLPAAPAAAHASLVSTDPAADSVLPRTPDTVTLTFNEPVRLTADEIRVYDAAGRPVDATATASGAVVTVDPAADDLPDGTYVVGWYVVSADGHPVSGSLRFSIGAPSGDVAAPPPPPESSTVVTAGQGLLHTATYVGLLVAVGLAGFVVLVLPGSYAGDRLRRRLRSLTRAAVGLAVAGGLLTVPVASARAQGRELGSAFTSFDPGLVRDEILLAGLLVLGLGLVAALLDETPPAGRTRWLLLGGAALAAAAPAVAGHSRAYRSEWLLLPTDVLHVAAGSVWLGGLVGLAWSVPALAGREALAASTLARFSSLAGGLLLAVAGAGAVLAWRVLGSWSGFVDTGYGRLLLAKLAVALAVVAVAAWNRFRLLPEVTRAAGHADRVRAAGLVRRGVTVEAVLLVGLLGLTGFLVNASPRLAPVASPVERTGVAESTLGELRVLAELTPGEAGPNRLVVRLQDRSGEPVEPSRLPVVRVRSAALDLGRVPVTTRGGGTFRASVLLPEAGRWEVQVSLRQGRFDNPVTTLPFDVR